MKLKRKFVKIALTVLIALVVLQISIGLVGVNSVTKAIGADINIKRVLLFSVDGVHAVDLANYIKSNQQSTLANLSQHGITYTNASTSSASDSFPGLLAQVTGGSPISTGVFYDDSYDPEPFRLQDRTVPLLAPKWCMTRRLTRILMRLTAGVGLILQP